MLVIDTSVALKWFFPEAHSDASLRLLTPLQELAAPTYLWIEFDNVVAKKLRRGEVDEPRAREMRRTLRISRIRLHNVFDFLEHAFKLAVETRRSVYDCTFLALAVHVDAQVITADRRFLEGVLDSPYRDFVTWVADFGS